MRNSLFYIHFRTSITTTTPGLNWRIIPPLHEVQEPQPEVPEPDVQQPEVQLLELDVQHPEPEPEVELEAEVEVQIPEAEIQEPAAEPNVTTESMTETTEATTKHVNQNGEGDIGDKYRRKLRPFVMVDPDEDESNTNSVLQR